MRQILIVSLLLSSISMIGQVVLSNPDYYVCNSGLDTLFLKNLDFRKNQPFGFRPANTTSIVDTIQLDGKGAKEIVFERTYSGVSEIIMQAHQSKEETIIHKYEIWNIDTKTLLFESVASYHFRFEYWSLLSDNFPENNGWTTGFCGYDYPFSIDSTGRIEIGKATTISTQDGCTPDKEEGFYIFTDGQYRKE